jgi:hypothetical protein
MTTSLYDATVATFIQTLGAVEGFLGRGLEHCRSNSIDPKEIVESRVYHDMLPFRYQVLSTISHSSGAIEAIKKGVFSPPSPPELSYEELQQAVSTARDALKKLSADEVNALADRDVKFEFRDRSIPFTGGNFLLSFSTPNFFFHASMAYGILRSKGVPLGKRDFMGQLRIKA